MDLEPGAIGRPENKKANIFQNLVKICQDLELVQRPQRTSEKGSKIWVGIENSVRHIPDTIVFN